MSENDDDDDDNQHVRVYDARYKIPANSSASGIMTKKKGGKAHQRYRILIRNLERFKKCNSSLIVLMMGTSCILMLSLYLYSCYLAWTNKYYISRTYMTVTEVIDYETITSKKIEYFLYRNQTDGALDADGSSGISYIVTDVKSTCGGSFEALLDLNRVVNIRNNMVSIFMKISEVLILLLMLLAAFLACVWIPYNMNEYDIPIYLRETESNVWLDFLKMRLIAFALFITLSGCLPQFNFYNLTDLCLHT